MADKKPKKDKKKKLPKKRSAKAPKVALADSDDEGPPVPTRKQSGAQGLSSREDDAIHGLEGGRGPGQEQAGHHGPRRCREEEGERRFRRRARARLGGNAAAFGATSAGFAAALSALSSKYGGDADEEEAAAPPREKRGAFYCQKSAPQEEGRADRVGRRHEGHPRREFADEGRPVEEDAESAGRARKEEKRRKKAAKPLEEA